MKAVSGRPAAILVLCGVIYLVLLAAGLVWFHMAPEMVLGLTLAGIGVPLLCIRPMVGVHLFVMTLYVENAIGENILVMKAIGAATLVSWLLNFAIRRRLGLRPGVLMAAMAALVFWCGVTSIFAQDPREALLRTFQFLQLMVAALMFSSVLDSVRRIHSVFVAIVLWSSIATLIAVSMYYLGITPVAQGLIRNRNGLAMYINIAIVCAYVLFQAARTPLSKLAYLSTFPIFFLGVALTLSRTGLIMLLLALALVWLRLAKERKFFVIGCTVLVLCVVGDFLPQDFWQRTDTIVPAIEHQQDTFGLRVRIWKVGLEMLKDHPITGVGAGNFLGAFSRYAHGRFLWRHLSPHNTFVGMAAETGWVGLILLILVLGLAMAEARTALRLGTIAENQGVRLFAVVAEVSIFAQIIGCFTGDGEVIKILWIMFGIAMSLRSRGLEAVAARKSTPAESPRKPIGMDAAAWAPVR